MLAIWKSVLVLWWNLFSAGPNTPPRELLPSACGGCHSSELAEWKQSRHSVAFTNGLFRFEFDARRTAWCASCHAPSAQEPRTVADDDPRALQGIGCVTCHVNAEGQLVARSKAPGSPHKTQVSSEFGSADFCGGCHEFRFPIMGDDGMPTGFHKLPMQTTVSEFKRTRSAALGEDCRGCHMGERTGGHRFVGSHDEPTLRSALDLGTCFDGRSIQVTLSNVGAAHSVPTGGVNRHMVLRFWLSEAPGGLVEHFIGRRFEGDEDGEKGLVQSTELAAGESRVFKAGLRELRAAPSETVNLELRYIYPLDEFAKLAPGTRRFATVFRERMTATELPECSTP